MLEIHSNRRIIIFIIMVFVLVAALLFWNFELQYYRENSMNADVNGIRSSWNDSIEYMDKALIQLEKDENIGVANWLISAEVAIEKSIAISAGYDAALNKRFFNGNKSLGLNQALMIYQQEIRSIRQYLLFNGNKIEPEQKQLLIDITADLKILQESFTEHLLLSANQRELLNTLLKFEKSLNVEFVKGHI